MATRCSWLRSQGCHDRRELFDIPAPDAFPAAASSQGLEGAGAGPVRGLRGCFPGSAGSGQPGLGWSHGEAEWGWTGQEAPLHHCSLQPPHFLQPLGLQLAQSPWAVSLEWDSGRVSGSCSSLPASYAVGAFLRGCGKSEASVHPLPDMGPLPAHSRPGRLSQQPAAEERPLQTVWPRAGSGGCSCLTPPSCFPS